MGSVPSRGGEELRVLVSLRPGATHYKKTMAKSLNSTKVMHSMGGFE